MYIKTICTHSDLDLNTYKVTKESEKNCRRVAYTMYPLLEGEQKDGKPNTMSTKGRDNKHIFNRYIIISCMIWTSS